MDIAKMGQLVKVLLLDEDNIVEEKYIMSFMQE